ncbi:hypothetical protein VTN77DRAFT_6103 [Rasamsonia byssochlamydoides]|uniref:uncharacterized protein n=1 Tax=Rasamsonia byssochlamydoides TaxID=89139 RepID=UPI0037440B60
MSNGCPDLKEEAGGENHTGVAGTVVTVPRGCRGRKVCEGKQLNTLHNLSRLPRQRNTKGKAPLDEKKNRGPPPLRSRPSQCLCADDHLTRVRSNHFAAEKGEANIYGVQSGCQTYSTSEGEKKNKYTVDNGWETFPRLHGAVCPGDHIRDVDGNFCRERVAVLCRQSEGIGRITSQTSAMQVTISDLETPREHLGSKRVEESSFGLPRLPTGHLVSLLETWRDG